MSGMTIRCLTLVVVALVCFGCGKQAEVRDAATPEAHAPVAQPITAFSNSSPQPVLALTPADNLDATLTQLTREVRKWIVQHQRPPKNFEEFAASTSVQVPAAPAGKKFALSKQMRVIVVNR